MKVGDTVIIKPGITLYHCSGIGTVTESGTNLVLVNFPDGKKNVFAHSELVQVDTNKEYCDCNSDWGFVIGKVDSTENDLNVKHDNKADFCPKCGMFKWSYVNEKGFAIQYLYEHKQKKAIIHKDQKVIHMDDGRRFGIYCRCNGNIDNLVEDKDYLLIGKGFLSGYQNVPCSECLSHKWVYISAKGRSEQIKYETAHIKPAFCGCNSDIEKAVCYYTECVEETDEQCPECGYFKYHFTSAKVYSMHKKWKEGKQ